MTIPNGIICRYNNNIFTCEKGEITLTYRVAVRGVIVKINDGHIEFSKPRSTKKDFSSVRSISAHLQNIFQGLQKPYVYTLETCNVHFPMILKKEGENLIITNFLGERIARRAKILSGVELTIKGTTLYLSSHDKESAGQTAANIERATRIAKRDRRIFQDGIFITHWPGEP